jgi:ABC-type uncharacterized transport system ATPase subunit
VFQGWYPSSSILILITGELQLGDDVNKMKKQYEGLGTLVVELTREEITDTYEGYSNYSVGDDLKAVPEKALKGTALDTATS